MRAKQMLSLLESYQDKGQTGKNPLEQLIVATGLTETELVAKLKIWAREDRKQNILGDE